MKTCKDIPIRFDRDRLEFMGFFSLSLLKACQNAMTFWYISVERMFFFFYSFFLSLLSYLLLSNTRLNGLYFYSWQPLQQSSRALAHHRAWRTAEKLWAKLPIQLLKVRLGAASRRQVEGGRLGRAEKKEEEEEELQGSPSSQCNVFRHCLGRLKRRGASLRGIFSGGVTERVTHPSGHPEFTL